MRQVRGAMRSGAASSRAAAKDNLRVAHSKWQPGLSPLEEEERLKVIIPTNAQQVRQINTMIDTLMQDGDLDADVRKALALWKVNYQMESVPDQVRRAFLEGFWCWLLGRGNDEQTKRTLWGRANVAAHNSEVAAYLETFARKRTEYVARLILMAEHVPDTLVGFYLYYKASLCFVFVFQFLTHQQYIACGALKKVQDPADPQKWFYSMDNEQFLEDWDLFEQEAGNYAHIIEPAAKPKNAAARPFGGDETNTIPTDPYPAQPNDRRMEACMDNLTQRIMDLNQSLSLSHIDRRASMSLSARRRQSTEPGTLAAAGSEMTQATAIDEEDEFDPDGGDGRDDEADQNQSAVFAEKLSESIAASHELSSSIRELIAEQRARLSKGKEEEEDDMPSHIKPHGERAKQREEALQASFTAVAETPVSPPLADLHSPPTMAALETAVTPSTAIMGTPMPAHTPATAVGTPMHTPDPAKSPRFIRQVEDMTAHVLALGDDWQERVKNLEQSRLEARSAELGKIRREANDERAHAKDANQLEEIDAHTKLRIDRLIDNDMYARHALRIAVEARQAVANASNSSSEDIPLGVLAAQKGLLPAPKKVAGVLGDVDSEGSSADIMETSKDRAMIDDSEIASSSSGSVHEATATISDASELADSLAGASSDSFDPGSVERAKDALAAQRIATHESERKEEELKKRLRSSKKGVAFEV